MTNLIVTSLSSGAGKTMVCAGLAKHFQEHNKSVGYLKVVMGATTPDADAQSMKELLSLPEPVDMIAPAFSDESQSNAGIRAAVERISAGKDIVLIECPGANAGGIAKTVSGNILLVVNYSEKTSLQEAGKSHWTDIIINKVPVGQLDTVRAELAASFRAEGINVLGILPEDRTLLTFTIGDLVKAVDGRLLNNPEKAPDIVEYVMLGAMTVDSGLPYYGRKPNKVAVVRAGRPDMAMAALATSTRALVLAGKAPMIPQVKNRAEDKKVPLVTTELDVKTVASRLEDGVLKLRFNAKNKLPAAMALLNKGLDFGALHKLARL